MSNTVLMILANMASFLSGNVRSVTDEHTFIISRDLIMTMAAEKNNTIGLYCTVYRSDDPIPIQIKDKMLHANYGCAGTAGATLGLFQEDNSVMLTQIIQCVEHIPERKLIEMGINFIDLSLAWHEKLNNQYKSHPVSIITKSFHDLLKI
jgi:hypothetical protein